jgi:hypothetical protein
MGDVDKDLFERQWERAGVFVILGGGDGGIVWFGPNGLTTVGPWDQTFGRVRAALETLSEVAGAVGRNDVRIDPDRFQKGL